MAGASFAEGWHRRTIRHRRCDWRLVDLADFLAPGQRKGGGWILFANGVLSTIPLAMEVLGKRRPVSRDDRWTAQRRSAPVSSAL
jgi:hypothetical protein